MKKYVLLGLLTCATLVQSIDLFELQGDKNVLRDLGFRAEVDDKVNRFIRLRKNYNNTHTQLWNNSKYSSKVRSLKSFAFECIFRIDETLSKNIQKNEFVLFALENISESKNVLEIGLNKQRSLKFSISTEQHYDTTITFDNVMKDSWHKLLLSYENGVIEYWFDCMSKQTAHEIYPIELAVHYMSVDEGLFPFSVNYMKGVDSFGGRTFGNLDISKMIFYSGYLRPSELNCCDIPKVCN